MRYQKPEKKEFEEKVIEISRISRTVKGGRRIRFRALVVIGNRNGKAGYGVAKSAEVVNAITKAVNQAKKKMMTIQLNKDRSIQRQIKVKYASAQVIIKPATIGTSLVAGGPVRSVVEAFGIKNLISKNIGSANKVNIVKAVFLALKKLN
ncbi:30S ribosomal protein S5 [Candidatus Berkelbacteria bacterium CG_4_8_14_3_um_filter_33_6]|uniref:Small ribosomal subunit protein uS5 n=1 Tax=Candidatus Berkelbacteria bacterium CG_4_10_14_0_2_um_filter_35_9_33_12 TaxID=1974499 RepID=A0A2M7W4M6_9BACT|nr:MAG: 30S ribosomal protein S5 [Candidatus Berkelbacteria bacterium CG23_combo_of_CG06-09_8_20_14_all_33_15]PIS08117.1 MAG: 30S ribosomal protein S5 [Candidatus Berkelbacteria bacterium CG10_big_fil_rev_8_21_14_0_10_33_10]PIX31291.1 MAG: 30S ribosomal protein S5 [Candidatus Berkelbacteria bacterium CG_4_8_14_3_um_filter_33_6]PIZ28182.1 MAG: 30S ribosomal protein S5 [Candidatus Berkelbacteria bacterium CG_4_10_14_0_8_um_filter_35_9_33_8]PJA20766.1 MAG: 30S ribosomal protein S5 [Candidatus Berk